MRRKEEAFLVAQGARGSWGSSPADTSVELSEPEPNHIIFERYPFNEPVIKFGGDS